MGLEGALILCLTCLFTYLVVRELRRTPNECERHWEEIKRCRSHQPGQEHVAEPWKTDVASWGGYID